MILNNYDGLSEEEIRNMSHEELVEAVLRLLKVKDVQCENHYGSALLSDNLADAFRNRNNDQ